MSCRETTEPLDLSVTARTGFSLEASTYSSPSMFERRRRILREARKLLIERGLESFGFSELGKTAKVARKTIYNAFGGKERVIAMAIRQDHGEFVAGTRHAYAIDTLDGVLEQLTYTHVRDGEIKNYTKAVTALYHSPTTDPSIGEAMRQIGVDGLNPWVRRLKAPGKLKKGVDIDDLVDNLTNVQYMILAGWCLGAIEDDRFWRAAPPEVLHMRK
jgi:AcrR family transcriptional regulator